MIFVTQGHERGIGPEVFLKSFLMLETHQQKKLSLIITKESFDDNLKALGLSPLLFKNLSLTSPDKKFSHLIPTLSSLLTALEGIGTNDILVTLPTSKDQLHFDGIFHKGYTEFFRYYFKNENISMAFKGKDAQLLLMTDHIPLREVATKIDAALIVEKLKLTLDFYAKYFKAISQVVFSGINPHVGEGGLLGNEDQEIDQAIIKLKKMYPVEFLGPYSGDTLHAYENKKLTQLFVYMFHDQALARFKAEHGLLGTNLTVGLPFLRMSVDHGTAFPLYGQNKANISGMMFLFRQAFEVDRHEHQ